MTVYFSSFQFTTLPRSVQQCAACNAWSISSGVFSDRRHDGSASATEPRNALHVVIIFLTFSVRAEEVEVVADDCADCDAALTNA